MLPLLESDLAELALACCNGTLSEASLTIRGRRDVHGGRGRRRLSRSNRRSGKRSPGSARLMTSTMWPIVFLAGTDGATVTGGRVLAVTGVGDSTGARPATTHTGAWRRSTSTGCRSAATSAGGRPALCSRRTPRPASTSTRARGRSTTMKRAVERTHGPAVLRGVGSFGGAFSGKAIKAMDEPVLVASHRWRRHEGRARCTARSLPRCRRGHRQPLHQRRAGARRPAAVLPRLHRVEQDPCRARRRGRRPGWPRRARQPAARCSAARPRRCQGCTPPARSTSPARWWGSSSSATCCRTASSRSATC